MTTEGEDVPDLEDLVKLMFQFERRKTSLGRTVDQMASSNDSVSVQFDWDDLASRDDFVKFLVNELHAAYGSIVTLAKEVVRLQDPTT